MEVSYLGTCCGQRDQYCASAMEANGNSGFRWKPIVVLCSFPVNTMAQKYFINDAVYTKYNIIQFIVACLVLSWLPLLVRNNSIQINMHDTIILQCIWSLQTPFRPIKPTLVERVVVSASPSSFFLIYMFRTTPIGGNKYLCLQGF